MQVSHWKAEIERRLACEGGFEMPARQVDLLIAAATHLPVSEVASHDARFLSETETAFIRRYLALSPLPPVPLYVGYTYCRDIRLRVTLDTLLPGTETERMIDLGLNAISGIVSPQVVDAGTGCGVIAVALALGHPRSTVHAIDISIGALEVARQNVLEHCLARQIHLYRGNWCAPLGVELRHQIDLMVSNPPYCSSKTIKSLQRGFSEFAPFVAINGGSDGLDCFRSVITDAVSLLRPDGVLLFQTDAAQAKSVARLLASASQFASSKLLRGSDGKIRFVAASRLND